MKTIPFRVTDITRDRRNVAQLESARKITQDRLDQAIERHFNEKVRLNIQRRLNERVEEILSMTPSARPRALEDCQCDINIGSWT